MSTNYYYIVSGLPDLSIDVSKIPMTTKEFYSMLSGHCFDEDDEKSLRFIQYQYDNKNLVSIMEKKNQFDERGFFSLEELESELKTLDNIPSHMKVFLEAEKNSQLPLNGFSLEDNLLWFYYKQAFSNKNSFIRNYFQFDSDLRNVLAGINVNNLIQLELNKEKIDKDKYVLQLNEHAEKVVKSSSTDFSLSNELKWVEEIISINEKKTELIDFEKAIDDLRLKVIDELTSFSYFQVETILAYALKLAIIERWVDLDEQKGKVCFENLVDTLVKTTPQLG